MHTGVESFTVRELCMREFTVCEVCERTSLYVYHFGGGFGIREVPTYIYIYAGCNPSSRCGVIAEA
jgi:hypothetical protein